MASLIPDQNIPFFIFKLNQKFNNFKQVLITIAAVVLVGSGPRQQSAPTEEAKPEPTTAKKALDIDIYDAISEGNIEAVKRQLTAGTDVKFKNSALFHNYQWIFMNSTSYQ